MTTPIRWGNEFLVNTTTTEEQEAPDVAHLADGRFVITWWDGSGTGGDTSGQAVRAQIYNADGSPSGGEFIVNTTTDQGQANPSITGLDDGRFVITWEDASETGGDTDNIAIRGQMFNADGTASGGEFLVNSSTASSQTAVRLASLEDGGFVATWTDPSQAPGGGDLSGLALRAQIYNEDGTPRGGEFLVNTTTFGSQSLSRVAGLENGGFVITWDDNSQTGGDTSSHAVRGQVFGANGVAVGGELLVNTTTAGAQGNSSVSGLAGGGFVVTWDDTSQTGGDTTNSAVRAQIYNADGTPLGGEFLVNTTTALNQYNPEVATLNDGRFVITWMDGSQTGGDTSDFAIRAQVFNPDGSPSGEEFLVNTTAQNEQEYPRLSVLPDGRIVIAWTDDSSSGGDTDLRAIRAQILDPRLAAVDLAGTMLDDDLVGTGFGDRLAGFWGDDTLRGGAGDDRIDGEDGDDTLGGGWGNDRLLGGDGDDVLAGQTGHDRLYGGDGNDDLNGGFGLDFMAGGNGDDRYVIDRGGDVIVETTGGGTDTAQSQTVSVDLRVHSNVENATLTGAADLNAVGSEEANRLIGNDGANRLIGFGGNDRLIAGAGSDTLIGGLGRDVMTGGTGADTFEFNRPTDSEIGALRDIITDFEHGTDVIDLAAIDAATGAGNQAFTFIGAAGFSGTAGELRVHLTGAAAIVQADRDGDGVRDFEILLQGVTALDAGDFIL